MHSLAEEITKLMNDSGLKPEELAVTCGVSGDFIRKLMRGDRNRVGADVLYAMCAAFHVPMDHFAPFFAPDVVVPPPPHQPAPTFDLPNFGEVPCGPPEIQFTNPPGFTPVSASQYGDDRFVLRAKGDSMTGRNIQSGDLLIFRQADTADHGDVVVAWTGNGTTVKVYHERGERPWAESWLYPASEHGKPAMMTDEYRIIGVLKGVMRDVQSERPPVESVKPKGKRK